MTNFLSNLFNRQQPQTSTDPSMMQRISQALVGRPEQVIPSTEFSGAYSPLVNQVNAVNSDLSSLPQADRDLWNQTGYGNIHQNAAMGDTSNIPALQNAYENMGLQGGLNVVPATRGFIGDIQAGFRENAQTPFSVANLQPQEGRGGAFRAGEALGTIGRGIASPAGRALLTAGTIGALGGSPAQMAAYGGTAGLTNQQLKTQDQFYRNALQEQGIDTSNIRGYLNENMYKNYSLANYRSRGLDLRQQLGLLKDDTARAKTISAMLNQGTITPQDAKEQLALYGMNVDNLDISNQSKNAIMRAELLPYQQYALQTAPQIAMGQLGVAQGQLGLGQQRLGFEQYKFLNPQEKTQLDSKTKSQINENLATLSNIENGLNLIEKNPSAYTLAGKFLDPTILNRVDPKGIGTRTQIDNITAVYRKWLTGAQMSDQERISYERFLPAPGDNAQIVKQKLLGMQDAINRSTQILQGGQNLQPQQQGQSQQIGKYTVRVR